MNAPTAHAIRRREAESLARMILDELEARRELDASANWPQVGDLAHVAEELVEVARFLGLAAQIAPQSQDEEAAR